MEGVLLIDKPKGPSSFDVVRKVRKLAGIKKVGHAGTLDPLASGLMVICLGRYTKFAGLLTESSKVYDAVFTLGITTSTDDEEGEVLEVRPCGHVSAEQVLKALSVFHGPIEQVPPMFSAIKINGQRAYKLARAKLPVELERRPVEIFALSLESCALPTITVRVHCSKGTYIRSIARDVGEMLGVGAHVKEIRRVRAGAFDISDATHLDDLGQSGFSKKVLRGYGALLGIETITITDEDRKNAICGRGITNAISMKDDTAVALFGDEPVAILKKERSSIQIARVI